MEKVKLVVQHREAIGSRGRPRLRREGRIPGVLYGHGKPAVAALGRAGRAARGPVDRRRHARRPRGHLRGPEEGPSRHRQGDGARPGQAHGHAHRPRRGPPRPGRREPEVEIRFEGTAAGIKMGGILDESSARGHGQGSRHRDPRAPRRSTSPSSASATPRTSPTSVARGHRGPRRPRAAALQRPPAAQGRGRGRGRGGRRGGGRRGRLPSPRSSAGTRKKKRSKRRRGAGPACAGRPRALSLLRRTARARPHGPSPAAATARRRPRRRAGQPRAGLREHAPQRRLPRRARARAPARLPPGEARLRRAASPSGRSPAAPSPCCSRPRG